MKRTLAFVLAVAGVLVISLGVTSTIRAGTTYCNLIAEIVPGSNPPICGGYHCAGSCEQHGGGECREWYKHTEGSSTVKCRCDGFLMTLCHSAIVDTEDPEEPMTLFCVGQDWACPPPTDECVDVKQGAEWFCKCQ